VSRSVFLECEHALSFRQDNFVVMQRHGTLGPEAFLADMGMRTRRNCAVKPSANMKIKPRRMKATQDVNKRRFAAKAIDTVISEWKREKMLRQHVPYPNKAACLQYKNKYETCAQSMCFDLKK
jgi:hypothetical protein